MPALRFGYGAYLPGRKADRDAAGSGKKYPIGLQHSWAAGVRQATVGNHDVGTFASGSDSQIINVFAAACHQQDKAPAIANDGQGAKIA
ncbi:MAG: hypothetical protein C0409_10660, partial [Novosphingobium sp.]|nr:hypothetical protein [Novosphingobium sp.]